MQKKKGSKDKTLQIIVFATAILILLKSVIEIIIKLIQ